MDSRPILHPAFDAAVHGGIDGPYSLFPLSPVCFFRMPLANDLSAHLSANQDRALNELFQLLRIPSVSARSEHNLDTARAADWVADALRKIGCTATVHSTPGHPIVVGEWRNASAGAPTILIYGHYDVQPAEPIDLWD